MAGQAAEPRNIFASQIAASSLRLATIAALFWALAVAGAHAQESDDSQNKHFDIKSSMGDLHLGNDADVRETGLPVYPGARLRHNDENKNSANLSLFTSAFGMKLIVLNYDSDDAPAKVVAFYREKLNKYGKVLECRTKRHGGDVSVNEDKHGSKKELQCEGDNTGDIVELKVGTEDNQHVVAVEPADAGTGSSFAVVYVHTRGKQADI